MFNAASDEIHGVENLIFGEHVVDRREVGVGFESVDEVVVESFLLDAVAGGLGVDADSFVEVLAVASGFDSFHEDVFGRHEREFEHEVLADHRFVDDESGRDGVHEVERAVECEEGSGEREASVGGVVKRAFEPLGRGSVVGVSDEIHDEAGEAADALAFHGVAFVGHRGGTDLVFAEGFVDFFSVGEEADVGGDFVEDGGDICHRCKECGVLRSWVSLSHQLKLPGIKQLATK